MQACELLVGSDAFWRRAANDIRAAKSRLFVQAMTFEADEAGAAVGQAIADSRAADRRVLVDHYTRFVINDKFVLSPRYWLDTELRREVRATTAMFRSLVAAGVGVRVTNPVGPLLIRYGLRNHKKLIVADNVAYLGGVNFSDHNFAWHDLMLRIEGEDAAGFLAHDFVSTYGGVPGFRRGRFDGVTLYALDGRSNARGFGDVLAALAAAKRDICIVSPYLTFPFVEPLRQAAKRGVAVQLITPQPNNKPLVKNYLLHAAARAGFDVRLVPEMTHLKGILIDGRVLVLGSSNFDFASFHAEEELVAMVEDSALIATFQSEVIAPALAKASAPQHGPRAWHGVRSHALLRIAEAVVKATGGARRTATEWTY
jgi:cardiolipin synthase